MKTGIIYFNKTQEGNDIVFFAKCFITPKKSQEIKIIIPKDMKKMSAEIKKRLKGTLEDWWSCQKAQKAGNPHGFCFDHPKVNLKMIDKYV